MSDDDLKQFASDLVDEAFENIFLRFPEDLPCRTRVYRYIANELLAMANDMELA